MTVYTYSSPGQDPDPRSLLSADTMAVDVESTGVQTHSANIVGISFARSPEWGIFSEHFPPSFCNGALKLAHNATFDFGILLKSGIRVEPLVDTMIAAHLLNEPDLSLAGLAFKYLGGTVLPRFSDLVGKKKPFQNIAQMPLEELVKYSVPHAMATYALWGIFKQALEYSGYHDIFYNLEMPLVPIISEMELAGVQIDFQKLSQVEEYLKRKLAECSLELEGLCGSEINFNSSTQVSRLLFQDLGLPKGKRTRKFKPSTEESVLLGLVSLSPVPGKILEYRKLGKLLSTYVNRLKKDTVEGRIHTSFNLCGTRTGRLSSSGPNLQNIPARSEVGREIRKAFVAPPGWILLNPDYDQLELRVLAHFSKDPRMVKTLLSPEGDIHLETAMGVFRDPKKRFQGKLLNFSVIYQAGPSTVAREMGVDIDSAARWIEEYFNTYPGVKAWTDRVRKEASQEGYVKTFWGRKRLLDNVFSDRPREREEALKEGINTIIQGTGAEVVKAGMIRLHGALKQGGFRSRLILQIHDELLLEAPQEEVEEVKRLCFQCLEADDFLIPLTISMKQGCSWGEVQAIDGE